MGRYPEHEDRGSTVVDLESYRRQRDAAGHNTNDRQKPRDTDKEGTGARNAPIEGHRKD
jgi:hypothetical protein